MQDKRQIVGNSMMWWAKSGYTTDIKKAHVFTLNAARKASCRNTDCLWPKEYIDLHITSNVDTQHISEWDLSIQMDEVDVLIDLLDKERNERDRRRIIC